MASLTGPALEFATAIEIPEAIRKWLAKQGCINYEKIALAVTLEADIGKDMCEPLIAGQMMENSLGEKAKIKMLWIACREACEKDRKETAGTGSQEADAPIPGKDALRIVELWSKRHGFVITDTQTLVESIQGKMWRDFCKDPPQMRVMLAEELRTRACLNRKVGQSLALVPGKPVETVEIIADAVERAFELFGRIRAFFMTLAYISVATPTWFPLQAAMQAIDKVF